MHRSRMYTDCQKCKQYCDEISIIFTGKCCSVFDKKVGRITEDYSRECPECPMHYSSDTRLIRKKNINCLFRRAI